jgi:hypothetical protein
MPMPSTGIIVLLFFCGAGGVFMLWTLYHFVLESTRRKTYRVSERQAAAREREQDPEVEKCGSCDLPVRHKHNEEACERLHCVSARDRIRQEARRNAT